MTCGPTSILQSPSTQPRLQTNYFAREQSALALSIGYLDSRVASAP